MFFHCSFGGQVLQTFTRSQILARHTRKILFIDSLKNPQTVFLQFCFER